MTNVRIADLSIVMNEEYRYIDSDGKQRTDNSAIDLHIGKIEPVRVLDYLPRNEQRFDLSPWAYKRATDAAIARGSYRRVVLHKGAANEVVYNLAINSAGDCVPITLTGDQIVKSMANALATYAGHIIDDSSAVGMHVLFTPTVNYSAGATGAKKSSAPKPNRAKNRKRAQDAQARKQARANARKAASVRKIES